MHTHIGHSVEDGLISQWIRSARQHAENYQYRAYITQTLQLTFDAFPATCFFLPRAPLQAVSSIRYYGTDNAEYTIDAAEYFVDTSSEVGRVSLNFGLTWPGVVLRPINGFVVEFTAGYGDAADDVPSYVKDAIYLYCSHRYEYRTSEGGSIPDQFYNILSPERMVVRDAE